jgi:urease accessory protein
MTYRLARASIATATLVASAQAADAHIVASRLGDFYTGALHPLTDLQDLILWVAMGVLAGSLGASKGRWLVLAFPLGLWLVWLWGERPASFQQGRQQSPE